MVQQGRQFERVELPIQAKCRLYGDLSETWRHIQVLDLSASGMRFECEMLIEEQSRIEIQMMLAVSQRWFVVRGTVMRCKPLSGMNSEIGIKFEDLGITESTQIDQMVHFLKQQQKPSTEEPEK